ncbi:MAG: hypothetical protein RIT45_72 [Pseudomonadota bacterium]|jgi:hypothetical protein
MRSHIQAPTRRRALAALAALVVSVPALLVAAEGDDVDVPGEVVIKTPFEFIKFTVDGKPTWENHEYTERRKTLVVLGLDRTEEHTIVLEVREGGYEPLTITVKPTEFKRAMVRKNGQRVAVYRANKKARFEKTKPAPKDAPGK